MSAALLSGIKLTPEVSAIHARSGRSIKVGIGGFFVRSADRSVPLRRGRTVCKVPPTGDPASA